MRLEPLEDLPESYEVVVVAPRLVETARTRAPQARVMAASREDAAAVAGALVGELERGETFYAEHAEPDEPVIVVHRGPEIL